MNRLSDNKIRYLLFHLSQHWHEHHEVRRRFCFIDRNSTDSTEHTNRIIFLLSGSEAMNPINVSVLNREIPVLFPAREKVNKLYEMDAAGNLIFGHDYLRSAFYFLSGVQEIETAERDALGRFAYKASVQKRLECCTTPVVNYYFEIILQGMELFCRHHGLPFERRRLFGNFGFFLTHDVDQISFYHYRETAYKLKQLLGISPLNYSRALTLTLFVKGLFYLVNPFRGTDPWWNFDWMLALEKRLGIRSAFYFLRKEHWKEHRNMNSRYRFGDSKIRRLMTTLKDNGFETGLHGTILSAENGESMMRQTSEYVSVTGTIPAGIRQHYLRFFHPQTFRLQEAAGFTYDTSLAFAEHEGYRNGYCYPFKPYDAEKDCMMNIWEIPLTMMEVSVLNYRKLNFEGLEQATFGLIEEAQKFGGLFSLLWHNSRLTEYEYPGVTAFYTRLLEKTVSRKPEIFTGQELMAQLNRFVRQNPNS